MEWLFGSKYGEFEALAGATCACSTTQLSVLQVLQLLLVLVVATSEVPVRE
jgi:hypothetical protein